MLYMKSKLKEFRLENGWSRSDFAQLLTVQLGKNISSSLVHKWEQQERTVAPELALEIARLYKFDLTELVERK